jgi:hypothetical protein
VNEIFEPAVEELTEDDKIFTYFQQGTAQHTLWKICAGAVSHFDE